MAIKVRTNAIMSIEMHSGVDAENTAIILEKFGIVASRQSIIPEGAGAEIHLVTVPNCNRIVFERSMATLKTLGPEMRSKIAEILTSKK